MSPKVPTTECGGVCRFGWARRSFAALTALAAAPSCLVDAFYLPGVAPTEYELGSKVELKVNKLTSVKTQLPYRFYYLPYCTPSEVHVSAENLGEILLGDSVENSIYDIQMNQNKSCVPLCEVPVDDEGILRMKDMIDHDYVVNWLVDNLPAVTKYESLDGRKKDYQYVSGFPVGIKTAPGSEGRYYWNNHVTIGLQYHEEPGEFKGFRIVGFEVYPKSIAAGKKCEENADPFVLEGTTPLKIPYTYDVQWRPSPVRWASRWDAYLRMSEGNIHWFSIINSLMIVLLLSAMVAVIMLRTLHRDIARYNEVQMDDSAEETGWKLVHGDVFRKPPHSKLLAVAVGSGIQLLLASVVALTFSAAGFLSPVHRGSILQGMLLLFTFAGGVGGYTSARLYKMWKGEDWKTTTLMTAFLYPGTIFLIFFILNLFIWGTKSSGAVPFATMFALLVLWFGISVPLVFLGAFFGFKKAPVTLPVRTNQIPRQIPQQPWYVNSYFTSAIGGILPFGAVFTELFFILTSIWQHQFYYLFGFLMLVIAILTCICAEISIALTYFQLTSEDYQWWWRSFFASATSAVYIFLYSGAYFVSRMQITFYVGTLLYFGYMFVASFTFALLTGAVGFLSSFLFVRAVYGSIKID